MTDHSFPKSARLIEQQEFDRVHGENVFAADDTLVVKGLGNKLDRTRLGLSVGKKVGNAVCRNRWKRLIREAFRLQKSQLPSGLDLVIRPRKGALCEFEAIYHSLGKLTRQIKRRLDRRPQP